MNRRTPLFIALAIISVMTIPWIHRFFWKVGFCLYKALLPFMGVTLFGPLIFVLGVIQCLGGKESNGYKAGMWYMVIGTILITYALSFSFYSALLR